MSSATSSGASFGTGDDRQGGTVVTDTMGNAEQEAYFASTRGQHAAPVQAVQAAGEATFSGNVRGAHAAPQSSNGQAAGRSPGPVADMTAGQPSAELMYLPEIRDYTRETRDASKQTGSAVTFIAWVVAIVCVISLILGIVAAVQLSKLNSQVNGGGSTSSNCLSQGGTDPSC